VHEIGVRDLDGLTVEDAREHRLELGPKLGGRLAVLNDLGRLTAKERLLIDVDRFVVETLRIAPAWSRGASCL